jgi:hypothetical protein
MSAQQFQTWKPIDGVPARLYLEALHDDYGGLRFLLQGEDRTGPVLRLIFESPIGYRNINESYRSRTWASVPEMKGLSTLLIVENSEWVRWLVEEAGGILRAEALTHYAIYTPEDCVDIVTEFPPTAKWMNGSLDEMTCSSDPEPNGRVPGDLRSGDPPGDGRGRPIAPQDTRACSLEVKRVDVTADHIATPMEQSYRLQTS